MADAIKNVHGNTLDRLGGAIVGGDYPAGGALPPEPVLCESLGVSRTVVREAVKSLAAKGLVSTGPKVGTRVLPTLQWNWFDPQLIEWQTREWRSRGGFGREFLVELQEMRRIVEPAAARLAASRASDAQLAEIDRAWHAMARAIETPGADYVSADVRFHQLLLGACGNRLLAQMSNAMRALLRLSFEVSTRKPDGARDSLPAHRLIVEALLARNPGRAERATLALIDSSSQDIDSVLRGTPPRRHRPVARRAPARASR